MSKGALDPEVNNAGKAVWLYCGENKKHRQLRQRVQNIS